MCVRAGVFLCCCCLVLLEKSLEEIGLVLSSPASLLGAIMIASRASADFFPDHRSGSSYEPFSIDANLLQVAASRMSPEASDVRSARGPLWFSVKFHFFVQFDATLSRHSSLSLSPSASEKTSLPRARGTPLRWLELRRLCGLVLAVHAPVMRAISLLFLLLLSLLFGPRFFFFLPSRRRNFRRL